MANREACETYERSAPCAVVEFDFRGARRGFRSLDG